MACEICQKGVHHPKSRRGERLAGKNTNVEKAPRDREALQENDVLECVRQHPKHRLSHLPRSGSNFGLLE